jgi:hypothetical protein
MPPQPQRLTVKVERFGPSPSRVTRAAQRLARNAAVRERLNGAPNRLLALSLVEPDRKTRNPQEPTRVSATVYDYANERALVVEGPIEGDGPVTVAETARQPPVSQEELEAALDLVKGQDQLGPAVRGGSVQAYAPMPPLVTTELPEGNAERNITLGLLPHGNGKHEIVSVNLGRGEVTRFEGGAPLTALADRAICGVPVEAGQPTANRGAPGMALVTVSRGNTRLWRFVAVRPAASSGNDGSGIELRFVDYKGRRVLYRAHVPILNVRYAQNACGPYRDWQWQEGRIQATGRDVAPGFRLCPNPAKTIMQSGTDVGNFLGVGIYVRNQEVVLVSELEAGWYRYISEWRLDANGTIRPRFGFAAVSSSCVCKKHHHHTYWRFDFDIGAPNGNRVLEFNDPAIAPGGANWHPIRFEAKRFRDAARKRRWRVMNASGKAYAILPGRNDRTARGDGYAKGDFWVLRSRAGQIDDYPITGTEAQLDKLVNNESVLDQDIVVWYGAHFTHDVQSHTAVGHVVGPDLVPAVW